MTKDNGRLDLKEMTGPMYDAIARLSAEISEIERTVEAIDKEHRDEAALIIQKAVEEAAPYRQLIADKRAAVNRWNLLIAREEQEAAQASAEPRRDLPTPAEQDGAQP